MATSNKPVSAPVQGTGAPSRTAIVQATRDANLPAGVIPPAAQALIDERKARNIMAQKIRGAQWGINDQHTARAIADYCYTNRIDPIRHIELLGGRVYLKADFYQEKGAEMIARGLIDEILPPDHIEADPRLDELYLEGVKWADEAKQRGDEKEVEFWTRAANEARREIARRKMLRVKHGAPEKAAAVVVYTIKSKDLSEPIEGCNWCGGGVRGKTQSGKWADPIGEAEPSKTAETRAARRAWKQLCTIIPAVAQSVGVLAAEEEGAALESVIADARQLASGDDDETGTAEPAGVIRTDEPYGSAVTNETTVDAEPVDDDLALDAAIAAEDAARDAERAAPAKGKKPNGTPF